MAAYSILRLAQLSRAVYEIVELNVLSERAFRFFGELIIRVCPVFSKVFESQRRITLFQRFGQSTVRSVLVNIRFNVRHKEAIARRIEVAFLKERGDEFRFANFVNGDVERVGKETVKSREIGLKNDAIEVLLRTHASSSRDR